ncbi:MAG: efflux RND transporter periplasmic adaptor subunit [Deltaproteobacteria bacterium]|nr:efflux RND transporter periplasmic adaptor subunit [Deltaproteobacteria bacterium]PWB65983.1 MAG: efflux RND transporter periplasmic adaptor subunit [Deltaproteobacteria bacterium]
MKKTIAFILAAVLLAAGGAYLYLAKNQKAPPFKTSRVERGDITQSVSATGTLNAVTTVQVGSQVSGTISKIFVDFNSQVKKGQPIAQIDTRLFEASVRQSRGGLDNAKANLEKAKVTAANSLRTLRRNKELIRDGFVSQADVDNSQTDYEAAEAAVQSAAAQVEQARGALSVAEANLGYTTIYSPVNGTVVSRNVDVGQTVAASFQTPTLFTIAQDLTKMQIDTNVDEADIGNAKVGQTANFTVDAYPEKTFTGMVHQVRNSPIITQNVVTYDVVIAVDNKEMLLKPGMTTNVSILTRTVEGVLKIPNAALRYRPSGKGRPEGKAADRKDAGGARVYILGKDGTPQAVPVKPGISDGTFTQLAEGNLKEGEALITEEVRAAGASPAGGSPIGMRGFR